MPSPDHPPNAYFTHGSIFRHVSVMTLTGTIGLIAVFVVDFLSLFYISRLKNETLTAAVGFAASIGFIQTAICIGMSIGLGATIARHIGAGRHDAAKLVGSSFLISVMIVTTFIGLVCVVFGKDFLILLGAHGQTIHEAYTYLSITACFLPAIGLTMAISSMIRAVGDAKRSMNVTLIGALVTAILDPILIFVLQLGILGAAISVIIARIISLYWSFRGANFHHLLQRPDIKSVLQCTNEIAQIAVPAILTNLATPIGSLFITRSMAQFGLAAVAAQVTIDRIVPVAFAFVFALTGSVGPIMAQNLGCGRIDRVQSTLIASLKLITLCVILVWIIFVATQSLIVTLFAAKGLMADLIYTFCNLTIAAYLFIGMLFVANASFNNLGFPLLSTLFNWGRASLGTIPFVYLGSQWGGPKGVLYGAAIGAIPFGLLSVCTAFYVISRLKAGSLVTVSTSISVPSLTAESAMAELNEIQNMEMKNSKDSPPC